MLSTGQGAVLSEHEYDLITGLRDEPDENMLTRGEHCRQMDIQIVYSVTISDEVRQWYIDNGCSLDSDLAKAVAAAAEQDGHEGTMVGVAGTLSGLAG